MKIFTTILMVIAFGLVVFNFTMLDYKDPMKGDSMVALIGIVASLCALFILLIFRMSKKIEEKLKN
ncbi:hypothetical protein [Flavobacterium sp. N1994]|jgi:hypothetical protein|uniref:hypothetical protein n=1 Tax=Flavobacterium sp. N1994 TaxID=2986827 RepID=UPI0022222C29|nr:hypothetical protein [Flavobacterium sp. N1994]